MEERRWENLLPGKVAANSVLWETVFKWEEVTEMAV